MTTDIKKAMFHSSSSMAIFIMILALALAAFSGGLMKTLTESLEPPLISFFRFFGYFILLLPIALIKYGGKIFQRGYSKEQIFRGLALVLGNTAFMYGVQHVDYANSIAILYVYPFLMISLSVWILRERISSRTWLGVFGGFLGVILVLRPDLLKLEFHGLFILFTGLMVALQMLLNRKLGRATAPLIVAIWGALVGCLVSGLFAPFFWSSPGKTDLVIILILSVCTALSQTLMIVAMTWASADKIAPFTYFEIPFAVLVGFLLFETLPDFLSLVGITLIIFSGVLVKLVPDTFQMRPRDKF